MEETHFFIVVMMASLLGKSISIDMGNIKIKFRIKKLNQIKFKKLKKRIRKTLKLKFKKLYQNLKNF